VIGGESGGRAWGEFPQVRKVRAPQGRVLGNPQASGEKSPGDGKCNRKYTADGPARESGKGEMVRQERTGVLATKPLENPAWSKT